MKDIKVGQGSKHYYKQHPDADFLLSKIANETAYEYFTVDLLEASKKRKSIMEEIVELQSIPKTLEDLYQGFLHWGFINGQFYQRPTKPYGLYQNKVNDVTHISIREPLGALSTVKINPALTIVHRSVSLER